MYTIKNIYKIGRGPSSSHTIGVEKAVKLFQSKHKDAEYYKAVLYNSLSFTGKGHGTDKIILESFKKPTEIVFSEKVEDSFHPNTLDLTAFYPSKESFTERYESIGGGDIRCGGVNPDPDEKRLYELNYFSDIKKYCEDKQISLFDYISESEGASILPFLSKIWKQMKKTIKNGINTSGILPGVIGVKRKAKEIYQTALTETDLAIREAKFLFAYAYAITEENANGGVVVTAPTCGASGVLPAVLFYLEEKYSFSEKRILKALAVAGLIGNIIKTNASVSGAECGCQAEIGSACVMAAAAMGELFHADLDRLECAMETAMEHYLGLTCDPIAGQVQIPCIERNAVAATRAVNAFYASEFLASTRKISFDQIIQTMYETGKDLPAPYRETSQGGLAKLYNQ